MDNYEDRPLDVLLRDFFDFGTLSGARGWTPDDQIDYDIDVAAIKVAVIREATAGTLTCHAGTLGQTYGDKAITPFNEGDRYALVLITEVKHGDCSGNKDSKHA